MPGWINCAYCSELRPEAAIRWLCSYTIPCCVFCFEKQHPGDGFWTPERAARLNFLESGLQGEPA